MSSQSPETSPTTNSTISPPPPSETNITTPRPPDTNITIPRAPRQAAPNNETPPAVALPFPPPRPPPEFMTQPPMPKGGLPKGTIVGLVVGTVLGGMLMLIAVGIFVIFYKRSKRKKRRQYGLENYSSGPPEDPKGQFGGPFPQQNVPPPTDGKVNFHPNQTPIPGVASDPQLLPMHVPSPAVHSSTDNSLGSDKPLQATSPGIAFGLSQCTFSYEELALATNGFSNSNILGQGGFGYVHKGVFPNGKVVAIKQLKSGSGQGEREFQAEVETISRVHHRHLVSLVGYCISGDQRLLVYEFVPNNTLEFHLHGKDRPTMDWPTRLKIALGSAKGLAYLHEDCHPKIIHRDIKASNILLDSDFEPKVADFGLARFSLDTDTHVSTRVMGTFGYLAPEYAASGKLTEKSDVFSFGVMLLELITGHQPIDKTQSFTDDSMVDWARPLLSQALENGNFDALVDLKLQKNYNSDEMTRMVACAATCVRHSARRRPRMSQVVRALEGNISLEDLNEGATPGHSRVYSSFDSSSYDTMKYNEDLKKFRKLALESQEQGTSEYSGPSSEYGLHPSASSSEGQRTTQEMELEKKKSDTKISDDSW